MIQILVQSVNPATRVGVSNYKLDIQNTKLSDILNNLKDIVDDIELNYQYIIGQQHTHPDYIMHLFTAMLSSKNEEFHSLIQREKDT